MQKNDAVFANRPTMFTSGSFTLGYKGSIFSPYGEQWKKMKRVLTTQILAPSMEKQLHHLRDEESGHLVRYIYNTCSNTTDVRHVSQHFCGNFIRRLVFGKRYFKEPAASSSGEPGCDEVAHIGALFTLVNRVYNFSVLDYFPALVGLDLNGYEKVVKQVMTTLNRLHDPIIEERIRQWSTLGGQGEKRDFLDVLVSLEDSDGRPLLSIEEIRAQTAVSTFVSKLFIPRPSCMSD
jgi:phenylalanine N-monooxygenase